MALQFSGKINDFLRCRYDLAPSKCQMYVGNKTIRVNAWKTDMSMLFLLSHDRICDSILHTGEIAFPRLLQCSLNENLILNQKLVEIDILFHFDAAGPETFVQFKAISPRGIRFFHIYGCSSPVVLCGWAHKESNLMRLGPTVLGDILAAIEEPYRIPQLPNTLIKLNWVFMTGILITKKNWVHFL